MRSPRHDCCQRFARGAIRHCLARVQNRWAYALLLRYTQTRFTHSLARGERAKPLGGQQDVDDGGKRDYRRGYAGRRQGGFVMGMRTYTRQVPEQTITVGKNTLRPYTKVFPAHEAIVAPTLQRVHQYMWGDCGPLVLSWHDGWLCPFSERIKTMSITCSGGRRKRCGGVLCTERNAPYPETGRERLIGRVICYEWCEILSDAYWDIPNDELLALPDDDSLAAQYIMRRVFRETDWQYWRMETKRRQ